MSNSTIVVLNRVSLFCSASGPERDSSEPDGPCLTGKFYDTTLTRATSSLLYNLNHDNSLVTRDEDLTLSLTSGFPRSHSSSVVVIDGKERRESELHSWTLSPDSVPRKQAGIWLDVIVLVKQLHMTDDKKHYMQLNLCGMNTNAGLRCAQATAWDAAEGWKTGIVI